MPTLDEFYREAQVRAGMNHQQLIRSWARGEAQSVEASLRAAAQASNVVGSQVPNFAALSNQARGNAVARHFRGTIAPHLPAGDTLLNARGNGYPDLIMRIQGGLGIAGEMKATSSWVDTDGNRRVITSSLEKLRALIAAGELDNPPAHFMCTVFYDAATEEITGFRTDFLDPTTTVNIRLEASTSQLLLARGTQQTFAFP